MTIPDYIREATQGSIAAKQYLYQVIRKDNWFISLRYLKNEHDAEDAIVDAFLHLDNNLAGFCYINDRAFFAYTNRIVVNECLKRLGKKQVFMVTENNAEDVEVADHVLDTLTAREILNLVLQLPTGYRTIFNMYVIEGYQHAEIAAILGISEGNSWSQLSKAKKMMQKLLTAKGICYGRKQQ